MNEQRVTFWRRGDADPYALVGEKVAVLGYGHLGSSMALNLRDSGVDVLVGNSDDEYRDRARSDGFTVVEIADAVGQADVSYVLLPDEVTAEIWAPSIESGLRPGDAVCFASGYALAFGHVTPASDVDVLLLAPRMLGEEVRATYLEESGFFSYVSVENDASGRARARLLALANACGSLEKGAMELTAEQEAYLDLFIEQTVGPYIGASIQLAFQVGVGAGLPPEAMVMEMYMSGEMSRTFRTFAEAGFMRSASWHGAIAQYGGMLRTMALERGSMERLFEEALDDIQSGKFAQRFQDERTGGYPTLDVVRQMTSGDDPMSLAEDRLRRLLD